MVQLVKKICLMVVSFMTWSAEGHEMENHHKYLLRTDTFPPSNHPPREDGNLNFSRSVGSSGNWIGCGFISRPHSSGNYCDIKFPYFSLVYVASGAGSYRDINGNLFPLSPGSVFMRLPGTNHSSMVEDVAQWREYYLDCDRALFEQLVTQGLLTITVPVLQHSPSDSLTGRFEDMLSGLRDGVESDLPLLQVHFLSLLVALTSQSKTGLQGSDNQKRIIKACEDFDGLYATRLDLRAYCARHGWSYEHFRKEFRKQTGIAPRDYLIRRRMDHACRQLRSSSLQISQIADQLGYASQYEFSNQFHRYFGVYPKHFRNGH